MIGWKDDPHSLPSPVLLFCKSMLLAKQTVLCVCYYNIVSQLKDLQSLKGGGGGGGSVRIEPSQQLLDDCTHKRNSKRKVGKPIYH